MANTLLHAAKQILPISVRAEVGRFRRLLYDRFSSVSLATKRGEKHKFGFKLATSISPLDRTGNGSTRLQTAKGRNVAIAAEFIDSIVIFPGEVFSYHALVGRPSRKKGFLHGLELHDGKMAEGLGGGCCQVSNMLYWLAINAGLTIVERHRHGFDLFPDRERTVPFGCGATVFYNYRDLRFYNNLNAPVFVSLKVTSGFLVGKFWTIEDPLFRVLIIERDRRFFMTGSDQMRENKIYRAITDVGGNRRSEEMLAHNCCQVRY